MGNVSRRRVLGALAVGAIVVGFDPVARSWVTEARADALPDFQALPPLDGTLQTDATTRSQHAEDFGHMVHRTPAAVLSPGSVQDVVRMVRYCRQHGIRIASRGKGHTTLGQSQVEAGLSIDMTSLATIHSIDDERAIVDAGVVWRDLLISTLEAGRTPPVLTDFTGLTVGGTLSLGGVSGASYLRGAQVDNVVALQVVTGEGDLVVCSRSQNRRLFDAALAGMGLVAVIVRAEIRLIPAKDLARIHRLFYADAEAMLADMRLLAVEPRFDHLRGNAAPTPGGWVFYLEATSFYTPGDPEGEDCQSSGALGLPEDPFEGLHFLPGSEVIEEQTYFDFCDAVYNLVQLLDLLGLGGLPHPWLDLFVPRAQAASFVTGTLASIDPAQQVPGSISLFYVFRGSALEQPLLRVPDSEVFFLFDLLLTVPPDPSLIAGALQRNRALYDQAVALGGKEYTNSAVELSPLDWKRHFQPAWGQLVSAKRRFDPDGVLGGGLSVFD